MTFGREDIENAVKKNIIERDFHKRDKKQLETFSIRLTANDKDILGRHFDTKGLKLSQGLRMVIKDYMNMNELR